MDTNTKPESVKGSELILKYKVRPVTTATGKQGLIVLLHGVGSNEDDLFRIADQLPADMVVISARAPYTLGAGRYGWYEVDFSSGKPEINADQAEKSRLVLNMFINQLVERYHADAQRVYMGGFSQGAIMSYSTGLTFPNKFAGIFMLSGRLLAETQAIITPSPILQNLKVFIAHGVADNMLQVDYARQAKVYLQDFITGITYHEYSMGHTLDQQEIADLNAWLLS